MSEFFVIVLGVLVALAADSLNDSRLDRIEEREYLERVHSEVASDTANITVILGWIDQKEDGLRRLDRLFSGVEDFPREMVLADLTAAANYGWNVGPLVGTATFEDLRSSGRLALIQDAALRTQIIEYYEWAEGEDRRLQARRTQYPHVSYRLVPFARAADGSNDDEFATTDDIDALVRRIRASELPGHVLAETNRALFVRGSIQGLRIQADALLQSLESALGPE